VIVPGAPLPDEAMLALVTRMQAAFTARGRSLADPDTATDYRITLGMVRHILTGARETGVLGAEPAATLLDMVDAAEQVPDHL